MSTKEAMMMMTVMDVDLIINGKRMKHVRYWNVAWLVGLRFPILKIQRFDHSLLVF